MSEERVTMRPNTLPDIQLEVITPERVALNEPVDSVSLFGVEGSLGIFPGHAPLITELQLAPLTYRQDGKEYMMAVMGGFVEVMPHAVRVVTHAAERDVEIDTLRAQQARQRAEVALSEKRQDIDVLRTEVALRRALVRLRIAEKRKSL